MNNILIICRKELKSYFTSPIAYALMTLYAFVYGFFFYMMVGYFVQASTEQMMMGRQQPMDVNEYVVRPLIMNVSTIGLFLIPMITMRLFAEEKRSGTIELLLTSPITDLEIILGKWLAAVGLYGAILFFYGKPEVKPILVSYLGLLLQGSAILSIGTFISSTTKNQIIAGAGSFAACLILWVLSWMSFETSTFGKILAYMSFSSHMDSFSKGVLDFKDLLYFASAIYFGLFLTTRSMESLRWRA